MSFYANALITIRTAETIRRPSLFAYIYNERYNNRRKDYHRPPKAAAAEKHYIKKYFQIFHLLPPLRFRPVLNATNAAAGNPLYKLFKV